MKRKLLFVFTLLLSFQVYSQAQGDFNPKKYKKTIKCERKTKDKEMKKGEQLSKVDRRKFKRLKYYKVDITYRVLAKMKLTPNTDFFDMVTSSGQKQKYRQYGILHFELQGKKLTLPVYQSRRLMRLPQYKTHLFMPFTDLTNGKYIYDAGRYLDLRIPPQNTSGFIIDFNKAYNPYCAYNPSYSCPIPPPANHLNMAIKAGEKKFKKH
ncbi:DUF1684 domain-containing protein [Microscilla marina]|uniref:DUF1684 domain-containing protein n=1 Tax=Microscilla marina ATCC 23134 TaxID=313606 RepID=A1ZR79_MICM2|nr:DUF1684 domain-containing protein [Microscilla marina]EAY27168.1 conserved hypothetical protein [Microscilla marina ATCC 23134]